MEQPNSELWQVDELALDDETLQVNIEEPFDMFGSGSEEEDYSVQTPEQKLISKKLGSRGNGNSDISTKDGSEAMSSSSSSSSSSLDAEFATCLPNEKKVPCHVIDGEVLKPKMIEIEADNFDMKENVNKPEGDGECALKQKDIPYENLLEKLANYETELNFSKNEISKLRYENLTLVEELGETIEKLRISEDSMKEMEIILRNELQESQTQLQAKIDLADQTIHLLQAVLASERNSGSELQEDYKREVEELKLALHAAQEDFSKDKLHSQSEMTVLLGENNELKIKLSEAEMRSNILEEQIKQYYLEKMEIEKSHETRESNLLDEIRELHNEVSHKTQHVESLNKTLDSTKLKYDTLMSEKDEIFAKLETKSAEVSSRDNDIEQLQGRIRKSSTELEDLAQKLQKAEKVAEELSYKVMEQEKELEKKRVSVFDREDEKREAIRQLCFSIEYYRSEYHELRQVLLKFKRPAVVAS